MKSNDLKEIREENLSELAYLGTKTMRIAVYEPESSLRHPIKLFKEMWFDLLASRELAWQLLIRDISAQYRQSFLGILWAFITPLVTALGLAFMKNAKILNIGQTDIPYPVYVMFSMSLWSVFTESLNGGMSSLKTARAMLMKIKVPAEAFVLARLGQLMFTFGIQVIVIAFLFIWFHVKVSWTIIIAPVALIHLIMFGTAIGLWLGPIWLLYGDINRIIIMVVRAWLFVTPVLFPIPTRPGLLSTIINLNPMTHLLVTTRELVTTGNIPNVLGFWVASLVALVGLLSGWVMYRLALPFLVERASS